MIRSLIILSTSAYVAGCAHRGSDGLSGFGWTAGGTALVQARLGGATISLSMPRRLELVEKAARTRVRWRARTNLRRERGPEITVELVRQSPRAVTDAANFDIRGSRAVLSSGRLPRGFTVVTRARKGAALTAIVFKSWGDTHLRCRATYWRRGGVRRPRLVRQWLERVCRTMRLLARGEAS